MSAEITFSVLDYVIFGSLFAGTLIIGIYFAWKSGKATTTEYLMGNRKMGILPVTASLMSSHFTAVLLLGLSTEVYYYGAAFILCVIDGFFGALATIFIYLPVFYEIQCVSVFEYLDLRFNKSVQLTATVWFHIQSLIFLSFGIYAPALIASQATGFSVWTCILTIGLICTLYTALGGIKAVMWTDTFQCLFMLTSIMTVIVIGFIDVGGIGYVWQKSLEDNKLNIFNFDTNPTVRYTAWTMLIGNGVSTVAKFSLSQPYIQRYLSTRNLKSANWTVWLNYFGSSMFHVMTVLAGLILYSAYWDCDPFESHKIESRDRILSFFVFQRLSQKYNGLAGLFAAGLISCAVSSITSGINSLATVTFKQILEPYCTKNIMKRHPMFMIKSIAFIYGLVSIVFVPVIESMGGIMATLISFISLTSGPAFGIFTLGMLFPRATSMCALTGFLIGTIIPSWIFIGAKIYNPIRVTDLVYMSTSGCDVIEGATKLYNQSSRVLSTKVDDVLGIYKISFYWYRVIAFVVTILVGVLMSFICNLDDSKKVDPKLISPIVHKIRKWCKLRKSTSADVVNHQIANTNKHDSSAVISSIGTCQGTHV